ncbi:MAG: RloB family protein [Flavobacteriaceae bacterium]|nr:RloB family protein [Flavobacteriaceae bacterium]
MSRKRKPSRGKKIKPTFFVFCEGKTEVQYIKFLKSQYRIPLEIDSTIKSISIDERYIRSYKKNSPIHKKDQTFLLYDLDVPGVLNKLSIIKGVKLLVSNPCIELWFLLHLKEQNGMINCKKCNSDLDKKSKGYKKGIISILLKQQLKNKQLKAINRAKKLNQFNNPSSSVYLLLDELEKIKKENL